MLVRLAEVTELLNGGAMPGLTKMEVAKLLRVSYQGVTTLVSDGHLATITTRQRRTGAAYAAVTPSSVDLFRAKYASVSAVAALWGTHPHIARSRLAVRGVHPVLSAHRYGTPIYRSADVRVAS